MIVTLLVNIMFSKFFSPQEIGLVGIIMFFINIANVLVESGFGGALIRLPEIDDEDYSTAFLSSLGISVCCYLALWVLSGPISVYYKAEELRVMLLVSGIMLFVNACYVPQNAKLIRGNKFNLKYISLSISVAASAAICLFLAYKKSGIWAMILFQLLTTTINVIILLLFQGCAHFTAGFKMGAFRAIYSFGINTTLSSILTTAFENVYQILLGKYFGLRQVGLYFQSKRFQVVPFTVLNTISQSVIYNALARLQNEESYKVYSEFKRWFVIMTIVLGALASLIYLNSVPIVEFLFDKEWLESIYYFKVLSIVSFLIYADIFNSIFFKLINKPRILLQLELKKRGVQAIGIVIGVWTQDIRGMMISLIFSSIISLGIGLLSSRKEGGKSFDLLVIVLIKVIIIYFSSVFCWESISQLLDDNYWTTLIVNLGHLFFVGCMIKLLRIQEIVDLFDNIKVSRIFPNKS